MSARTDNSAGPPPFSERNLLPLDEQVGVVRQGFPHRFLDREALAGLRLRRLRRLPGACDPDKASETMIWASMVFLGRSGRRN